jgi:F0F1-type ATP synthase delta subunit
MSESGPVISAQLKHLLAVVEQRRGERCQEVLDKAHEQARQVVKQAYGSERQRMHRELGDIRQKRRQQMVSVVAQRQTRKRQRRQQEDEELLTTTWLNLHEALLHRWRDSVMRQRWVEDLVNQTASVLVDRHWLIEHPFDWPAQERSALQLRLQKQLAHAPHFEVKSAIAAGLRICAGGACVDGSADGLLRERLAIEAVLLARINEHRDRQD